MLHTSALQLAGYRTLVPACSEQPQCGLEGLDCGRVTSLLLLAPPPHQVVDGKVLNLQWADTHTVVCPKSAWYGEAPLATRCMHVH